MMNGRRDWNRMWVLKPVTTQWRIQDFPDRRRQLLILEQKPITGKVIAKNCMKMKEIGPRGDTRP